MNIATMTDSILATPTDSTEILTNINDNIELFILLFVLFECLKLIRIGFSRLYKGKGV